MFRQTYTQFQSEHQSQIQYWQCSHQLGIKKSEHLACDTNFIHEFPQDPEIDRGNKRDAIKLAKQNSATVDGKVFLIRKFNRTLTRTCSSLIWLYLGDVGMVIAAFFYYRFDSKGQECHFQSIPYPTFISEDNCGTSQRRSTFWYVFTA